MKLSNYQRAAITSALKRSNQRLAQISKYLPNQLDETTGQTIYSATQRAQIAPFANGEYDKYLRESRSGNPTFDIRKILKDIESEELDVSEANDFLVKAAGVRFAPDGDITQTSSGGIITTKEILKEARESFGDLPKEELIRKYDEKTEIQEEFQFDYDAYTRAHDPEAMKSNPILSKLYRPESDEGTKRRPPLDYDTLKEIHDELVKDLGTASKKAMNFGGRK